MDLALLGGVAEVEPSVEGLVEVAPVGDLDEDVRELGEGVTDGLGGSSPLVEDVNKHFLGLAGKALVARLVVGVLVHSLHVALNSTASGRRDVCDVLGYLCGVSKNYCRGNISGDS